MLESLINWIQAHPHTIYVVVWLITLIESLVLLGWLLPGTAILAALGVFAGYHFSVQQNILVWLMAWIGTVMGHATSFMLGRYVPEVAQKHWPLRDHPKWFERCQEFFMRHGGKSVFIGRFLAPIRPILPLTAGLSGMTIGYFISLDTIAGALWISLYLLPGMTLGFGFWHPPPHSYLIILAIMVMTSLTIGHRRYHKHQMTSADVMSLILAIMLSLLIMHLDHPVILNVDQWLHQHIASEPAAWWWTWGSILSAKETLFWVYLCGSLLLFQQHRWLGLVYALSGIVTALSVGVMKYGLEVERPVGASASYLELHAFPSGHTTLIAHVLLLTGHIIIPHRHRWYAGTASLCITWSLCSRLMLGAHWFSDALGGVLLGLLLAYLTIVYLPPHRITPSQKQAMLCKLGLSWLLAGGLTTLLGAV